MKAVVGMIDGSTETWTTEKDRLHHVEVTPSGALSVYTYDGNLSGSRLRAARALGMWVTVDIDED